MDMYRVNALIKEYEDAGFDLYFEPDVTSNRLAITMSKDGRTVGKVLHGYPLLSEFDIITAFAEMSEEFFCKKEPEPTSFNKEILVVQVGALLTKEKMDEIRQEIVSQLADGVVFIPPYMDAKILQVPENVDVRVESTLGTHEFLEKDFNLGGK